MSLCVNRGNNVIFFTELHGRLNELMNIKHVKQWLKLDESLRGCRSNVGFNHMGLDLTPDSAPEQLEPKF